jgi:hypothetical protein
MQPNDNIETIDIAGLVADGHLDLEALFDSDDWDVIDDITTYTACVYGRYGDQPGVVAIALEEATKYGITAYRWLERDDSGSFERGPATLNRDEAVRGGEEYAAECDETPNPEEQIQAILDTDWFDTSVDAEEVREIINYIESYDGTGQGHVIVATTGAREWVTNGWVEEESVHVPIPHAGYGSWAGCAAALLAAIQSSWDDDDV